MQDSSPFMEPFTLIEETDKHKPNQIFKDFAHLSSAPNADHDVQYLDALRRANPDCIVTIVPEYLSPLRSFAAAGNATCELDTKVDAPSTWRGYLRPAHRKGRGELAEIVYFARFKYNWANEDFILYVVGSMQYVVKAKLDDENIYGPSATTDALIMAAGEWAASDERVVWVFDGYWYQDKELYKQVQKASWDKVILDDSLKRELTNVTDVFFSSKQTYEDLGVPWKRGVMFHGPPGNGKTISIKALMHTLLDREDPIPTLYVKAAPYTYNIRAVFEKARELAPCMLILEDIETIVTKDTRSYFFNELDGIAGNDGLFVVASTNYLERLDPGLTQRPSRFDRKYLFPIPNEADRTKYCQFWRAKLAKNDKIDFPAKLCPAMARITQEFSFAFLQECFVASLLAIARSETTSNMADDLDQYPLWVVFKRQADVLRKEIHTESPETRVRYVSQSYHSAPPPPPPPPTAFTMEERFRNAMVSHKVTQLASVKGASVNSAALQWR